MEIITKFNWDTFGHFRSFGERMANGHCKILVFLSLNGLVAMGSLISFLSAMVFGYMYWFPSSSPVLHSYAISESNVSNGKCHVFYGSWIRDESYPLYDASRCPFAERGFNCLANGRKDNGYTKWRWKPKDCDIPRFNAPAVLENLRGKRIVFVGDSLSRTQWESLICLLMMGIEDKRSVYEINGHKITKRIRFLSVRFSSFDLSIDYYRSVFLVQPGPVLRRAPKRVKTTLRLDKLDDISKEWVDSDVLIFNSGHWWTRTKLFEMGCYFQVGDSLKLGMPISTAFRRALDTWASWVETMIHRNRTSVFFRTFESSHWSGRNRNSCKVSRHPSLRSNGRDRSPISDSIIKVVEKMTVPVEVVHVTPMGAFRSDAHVGTWSDNPSVPDCSHWCLPGVPDTWNEIIFSNLLSKNGDSTNEH
ncbi:protein trichome berefringence-like 7 [Juglans microcarpa x Juglans regia]|uniref:protein trichome berefringence-like 7 n=1 Tax=Juglans microcarpa x Juglans regia TaxID=2249226 RepID=UPI001B7F4C89|nr:protein trichome berefringence-like 7 [Juglans microcarpa x Juglans regia]